MASDDLSKTSPADGLSKATSVKRRLLWICSTAGLLAGAAVLWWFGVNLWTLAAFVFLAACPSVVVWALAIERQQNPVAGRKP